MSCFRPLSAYRDRFTGDVTLGNGGSNDVWLELPCGKCIGCLGDRARAWSIRIMHEASLYDANMFVTLDYSPEALPASLSLEYRDYQLFMKRLRRRLDGRSQAPDGKFPIRFFCAGEYGDRYKRPHWHAILFNCWPEDTVRYQNGTYRSRTMEDVWENGRVVIGQVTARSACYVAGYTLSKLEKRAEDYEDVVSVRTGELSTRRREFVTMSRRPGIGAWWFERYAGDVFPHDAAVQDGCEYKVPRFYLERYKERASPHVIEALLEARYERAKVLPVEESSPERRAVREEVAHARRRMFSERDH